MENATEEQPCSFDSTPADTSIDGAFNKIVSALQSGGFSPNYDGIQKFLDENW